MTRAGNGPVVRRYRPRVTAVLILVCLTFLSLLWMDWHIPIFSPRSYLKKEYPLPCTCPSFPQSSSSLNRHSASRSSTIRYFQSTSGLLEFKQLRDPAAVSRNTSAVQTFTARTTSSQTHIQPSSVLLVSQERSPELPSTQTRSTPADIQSAPVLSQSDRTRKLSSLSESLPPAINPTPRNVQPTTYPSPPNVQPTTYPSPPNVQPTTYPSPPNLQPTTYPSPPNLQPTTYPSPPNLQPTTYPSPPNLQPTTYPSLPNAQPTTYPSPPNLQPITYPSTPNAHPITYPLPPNAQPITYPSPPNVQPTTYPSPPNVQPTTYPSSPNLQPTTYPSPQNLQRKTYPSPQNLQPTTHSTPQKLQTTIFLALKTSQQTFTRESMTPHHMYLTTVASFSDDLNSTTGSHDLVLWAGCKVPVYQPYGPDVKQFIKKLPPHKCSRQPSLIKVERDVLTLNTALLEKRKEILSNCTYEVINRVSEGQINYSKPVVFNSSVRLQADFIRVRCHTRSENSKEELVHTELHPILTKKQDVEDELQSRMEHFLNLTTKNSGTRSQPLSIVIVGMDSVSRLNMIRHLTSTRHFLLTQLQAIDLINYNKVGLNTFPNLLPMMSGKAMTDFNRSDFSNYHMDTLGISFLWDELKSAGYRTLFAEDWPGVAIFNYVKKGFKNPPAQYYYRVLELAKKKNSTLFSDSHRCFGTQPNDELVLNYTLAFQRLFRDKPHFGLTFLTRSSHDDVNGPSQVDGYHTRYLTSLVQEGLVKNTLFVFFSDHGMRFGGVRNTPQGGFEDNRPFMFLAFPPWFREEYPELVQRVQENAARLVTPFDIHATLLDVLYRVPGVRRNSTSGVQDPGISLFDEIPANRTCTDAGIPLFYCVCVNTRELTASSSAAKKAGTALIATLNAAVTKANVTDKCHRLQLSSINKAVELRGAQQYLRKQCLSVRNYTVEGSVYRMTVVARPGDGKFEALMSRCNGTSDFVIYGDLDRTNKYGNSSYCVNDSFLKKLCLCK